MVIVWRSILDYSRLFAGTPKIEEESMTPKTQSVCKHCQQPKGDLVHSRWAAPELHHNFEPVAEPASTGEPSPDLILAKNIAGEHYATINELIHGDFINLIQFILRAARPSEPAAPQTSAEHLKKCVKEGPDCDCVTVCKFAAAPQPVSGDAPKVEEIKADTLFGVYCSANPESIPKDRAIYWEGWQRVADYLNRLRPYFPPASQTPQDVHPEDFCAECKRPNIMWHTVSPIWNLVMRHGGPEPILCPVCFAKRGLAYGIVGWQLIPDPVLHGEIPDDLIYGKQQEETNQSSTSAASESQDAEPASGTQSQQTATKREKDSGKTLATPASTARKSPDSHLGAVRD